MKETISLALGFTLWGEEKGANNVPNGQRLQKKSTKDKRLPSWLVVTNSKISTSKKARYLPHLSNAQCVDLKMEMREIIAALMVRH